MGMRSPGGDTPARDVPVAARRRRRRRFRRLMLWLLTGATTAVLLVIGLLVRHIARAPAQVHPAALSASPRTASRAAVSGAHQVPPRHPGTAPAYAKVTDAWSGLSYRQLGSPWRRGCPSSLNAPAFDWTAGENTVAGHVALGGSVIDWHGLACSGPLQPQFSYASPADLEPTATSLVGALDPAYYAGVRHSRTTVDSSALRVSGHRAWQVEFAMSYPDGASQGLTWNSELGAVVVVDRGAGQAPAVFYVSVPASLGEANVTTLVESLRISG